MANGKKKTTITDKVADMNPAVLTVAGAVVGAGIAAAGAYALKNDKAREKIEKVVEKVGEKAQEFADTMKEDATTKLGQTAEETVKEVNTGSIEDKKGVSEGKNS